MKKILRKREKYKRSIISLLKRLLFGKWNIIKQSLNFQLTYSFLYIIIKVQKTVHKKGENNMLAVNYTNLRDNMKTYMDQVTDDYETMIVTRKNNKNVVMLSEESYNNLIENIHVMGNKSNYDWLMESKEQLEKGKIQKHNLTMGDINE